MLKILAHRNSHLIEWREFLEQKNPEPDNVKIACFLSNHKFIITVVLIFWIFLLLSLSFSSHLKMELKVTQREIPVIILCS